MTRAALAALVVLAGCLRATEFACTDDAACSGGHCEATGFCSFDDGACASGRRYGELSGALANTCVSADAPPDGPPAGCPASYMAIGGSAHRYLRKGSASWDASRSACAAEGTFLAIPDDMTELDAIVGLAGADVWVGIDDQATENTFVTVLGMPATFLPWDLGQPNNSGNSDCVRIDSGTRKLHDDRCNTTHAAVCECVP